MQILKLIVLDCFARQSGCEATGLSYGAELRLKPALETRHFGHTHVAYR